MVVGGSTYAFTLVLLVFLLGIGLGSAFVARRRAVRPGSAADAALAQGITGAGAALLLLFFAALPVYVIAVFGHVEFGAGTRLLLLGVAVGTPAWGTRLIDLGPTIYAREPMDAARRQAFLAHRGSRLLAFREGRNATVSVWEGLTGRTLRVNGKVDASDHADMNTQIMVGLAAAAARPDPASALVIGFGSGVTTRVLADVPGIRRVRVVEIEPAVLEMGRYFSGVNDTVLARPRVAAVVDDARSALQLKDERYDIIASEPSNPWVAGVATLYTPEYFQIVRSRLADDGVFCQWLQIYQLPLDVAAGIVRNLRQAFPHVEIWFSTSLDLQILASRRPLRYDRAWLARLFDATTPIGVLSREWLGVDSAGDHFGRRLLGEAGARLLSTRGTLIHRDDRPQLEFVAARRFLDPVWDPVVFDSLLAIGAQAGESPGGSPVLLARGMTAPRAPSVQIELLEAAHRARPEDPGWGARLALARLAAGDTSYADSVLPAVIARGRAPEALALAAWLAGRRGNVAGSRALLTQALSRGSDTGQAAAGLAALAARVGRWAEAGAWTRASVRVRPG